jgi:hypothetical protein
MSRRAVGSLTCSLVLSVAAGFIVAAPPADAAPSPILDNPAMWVQGDQADIVQWINMVSGSSHPRYSTHRVEFLYNTQTGEAAAANAPEYIRLVTNFAAISGTTQQDTFVLGVKLPAGVRIQDDAKSPLFCRLAPGGLLSDGPVQFQTVTDSTCRQGIKDVGNGVAALNTRTLNRGDIWEVYVPIVVDHPLSGADSGDASLVQFLATHANKDATEPDVAVATNHLIIGPAGAATGNALSASATSGTVAAGSAPRMNSRCVKAGTTKGGMTCVKSRGRLVWHRA